MLHLLLDCNCLYSSKHLTWCDDDDDDDDDDGRSITCGELTYARHSVKRLVEVTTLCIIGIS